MQGNKQTIVLMVGLAIGLAPLTASPALVFGQTITEIIDSSGDGMGNPLSIPFSVAVDGFGNLYVSSAHPLAAAGAFKITPGGVITQLIDSSGDDMGNPLNGTNRIVVDGEGNVYVTGGISDNAFKITPGTAIAEKLAPLGFTQHGLSAELGPHQ